MVRLATLILAVTLAFAGSTHADEAEGQQVRAVVNTLLRAIDRGRTAKALPLLATTVTVQDLPFTDAACKKSFGGTEARHVSGRARRKLVACLGKATWWSRKMPFRVEADAAGWWSAVRFLGWTSLGELTIDIDHNGSFVIARIAIPAIDRGGGGVDPPPPLVVGGVVHVPGKTPQTRHVPPTQLENLRQSGDTAIAPDDMTDVEMQRQGIDKIMASVKLCIDESGRVAHTFVLTSSGFPDYDRKLTAEMRRWTYRPHMINGVPEPVCSAVTFVHQR